jgi:GntR family transcriptional regulator, nutrient-sensing system regulator
VQLTVPKHYEIRDRIAELIAGAAVGTPVPTERELAERLHTSRTTVRQALAALELDGKLERIQGRGTFVAEPKRVLVRQLTSYTQDLQAQGLTASTEILSITRERANGGVAQRLNLRPGTRVHRIERLRGVSGESLAHDVAYLVGPLPRLRQELERRGSLYQTLREAYGLRLARVEDLVETVLADPDEAALLSVDVGLPMLLIHRTGWDVDDRPVEFTRTIFRGDRFSFIARSTVDDPTVQAIAAEDRDR